MLFVPPYFSARGTSLMNAVRNAGALSGLQIALDAADSSSYASGQTWRDLSGNGLDFYRGSSAASQSSDPTFNGTAGVQSAATYWSTDGGDFFRLDQSNTTFLESLHKAGAEFSFCCWLRPVVGVSGSGTSMIFATDAFSGGEGVAFYHSRPNGLLAFLAYDSSNSIVGGTGTGGESKSLSNGVWQFVGLSFEEGVGATWAIDDDIFSEASSTSYTSPSSGAADGPLHLLAEPDESVFAESGTRLAKVAFWNRTLSSAEMLAIFQQTRGTYGV